MRGSSSKLRVFDGQSKTFPRSKWARSVIEMNTYPKSSSAANGGYRRAKFA
jgi:hypothetical protein